MKVRVEFTVDVDREMWERTYGLEGEAAVRSDVREAVFHWATQTMADQGLLAPPPDPGDTYTGPTYREYDE